MKKRDRELHTLHRAQARRVDRALQGRRSSGCRMEARLTVESAAEGILGRGEDHFVLDVGVVRGPGSVSDEFHWLCRDRCDGTSCHVKG
jgi:hypothetical protein